MINRFHVPRQQKISGADLLRPSSQLARAARYTELLEDLC